MNIKNVPKIIGPSYGGIIYGLSVDLSYSENPSTLTLEIVSENGLFTISPSNLGTKVTVSVGNFSFTGFLWEYEISRTAKESILNVQIIDGSIVLDQHYVVLWRPGMFKLGGQNKSYNKTFDFSDETSFLPFPSKKIPNSVDFKEVPLGKETISIPVRSYAGKRGGAILVGTEQPPNSICDLATTDYSFSELQSVSPVNIGGAKGIDKEYRATHTGSLRSVLNQWCEQFGVSFYWDFSSNQIRFYDTVRGINFTPQNTSEGSVISDKRKASKRGTFAQYLVSWAAKPKEPLKEKSASYSFQIGSKFNPYSLAWLASRVGSKQKNYEDAKEESGKYGPGPVDEDGKATKRQEREFVESAILAKFSPELRYIYHLNQKNYQLLGMYWGRDGVVKGEDRKKLLKYLEAVDVVELSDLKAIGGENLEKFKFAFGWFDSETHDLWKNLELSLIDLYGKYYPIGLGGSGTVTYCSSKMIATISTQISTQGNKIEEMSDVFGSRRVFDRGGGSFLPSGDVFRESLELDKGDNQKLLNAAEPIILDIEAAGLLQSLIDDKIIKYKDTKNLSLMIIPDVELLKKIGLKVSSSVAPHPTESTIADSIDSGSQITPCKDFDEKIKNTCRNYEDIARKAAEKKAALGSLKQTEEQLTDGLAFPAKAKKITISAFGKKVDCWTPSDAQYQSVGSYDISAQIISSTSQLQTTYFTNGDIGSANNVENIDVIMHNATDSAEDSFRKQNSNKRSIGRQVIFENHVEEQTITYAGLPNIPMSPNNGLKSLKMSLSSENGFTTTVTYADHPPRRSRPEDFIDNVESRLKRNSFNAG